MKTIDWKSKDKAKALLIGHDPRLQNSDTIAAYALFADYYFRPVPDKEAEKRKYSLAKSTFEHILYLTNNKIKPEQVYVTNLCNESLPHAPKGKTVFIPKIIAQAGINNIRKILQDNPTIQYIFPMSLQVNYWLQKLKFYDSSSDFVYKSEPKEKGINNSDPYYEPHTARTFLIICGNQYMVDKGKQIVIPILHSKNFPLSGTFIAYNDCYEKIKKYF
jgi:hypothetical protein